MGASQLRARLEDFEDAPLSDWNFVAKERASNFADVIHPDAINVIDYLEMSDNFYQVGGLLTDIYNKLRGGIAVIAIQKDSKAKVGRGGDFGLEKPRLYMTLDSNPPDGAKLKLVKAKTWAQKGQNPNNLQTDFKIVNGAKLINIKDWHWSGN